MKKLRFVALMAVLITALLTGQALADGSPVLCIDVMGGTAAAVSAGGRYTSDAYPLDRLVGYHSIAYRVDGGGTATIGYKLHTNKPTDPPAASDSGWFYPTSDGSTDVSELVTGVTDTNQVEGFAITPPTATWIEFYLLETGAASPLTSCNLHWCRQ